jgi:hypothetical protein
MSKVGQMTVLLTAMGISSGFHDCIQASKEIRRRRANRMFRSDSNREVGMGSRQHYTRHENNSCSGGICVGMTNGPHEGGNASYPVRWNGTAGTSVHSTMTVPELPKLLDGITYYLWTDIFFGDGSLGRMNQMVPQLLLGSALDSSSGPPNWEPIWHTHQTWAFGAHYFFETADPSNTSITEGHAAYGELYPTWPGETLYTNFDLVPGGDGMDSESPKWILTVGVVGDPTRISKLVVERPYMGIGATWKEVPTTSWTEKPYRNMCINACWELYGASDLLHLPASGAHYELTITQPVAESQYPFTTWVRDEGNGKCPSCQILENHDATTQTVRVAIDVGHKHEAFLTRKVDRVMAVPG